MKLEIAQNTLSLLSDCFKIQNDVSHQKILCCLVFPIWLFHHHILSKSNVWDHCKDNLRFVMKKSESRINFGSNLFGALLSKWKKNIGMRRFYIDLIFELIPLMSFFEWSIKTQFGTPSYKYYNSSRNIQTFMIICSLIISLLYEGS